MGSSEAEAQCLFVSRLATHEVDKRKWKPPLPSSLTAQMSGTHGEETQRPLSFLWGTMGSNKTAWWMGVIETSTNDPKGVTSSGTTHPLL